MDTFLFGMCRSNDKQFFVFFIFVTSRPWRPGAFFGLSFFFSGCILAAGFLTSKLTAPSVLAVLPAVVGALRFPLRPCRTTRFAGTAMPQLGPRNALVHIALRYDYFLSENPYRGVFGTGYCTASVRGVQPRLTTRPTWSSRNFVGTNPDRTPFKTQGTASCPCTDWLFP